MTTNLLHLADYDKDASHADVHIAKATAQPPTFDCFS